MAARSLDVDARQCLVDFFDDPNQLRWHHRLLLIAGGGNDGKWICATPDFDIQVIDLSCHRVIPLRRHQVLPPGNAHETYAFDAFEPGEYEELMRSARDLALILGFEKAVQPADGFGVWRVADTAAGLLFGTEVPHDALGDDTLVIVKDTIRASPRSTTNGATSSA